MWDRPALMNAVADLLFGAVLLAVVAVVVIRVVQLPAFALREVQVDGELRRVTTEQVTDVVRREIKGNFFTLDLARTRGAFERLPWVRHADVRRQWPARVDVALEEHEPLARWDDAALVNTHGELFRAAYGAALPRFSGPDDAVREMAIQYRYFRRSLAAVGESPAEVRVSPRRAWQLKLESGTTLALGREDVEARLARFVGAYGSVHARLGRRADYVDLRYPNGFAVRVPESRDEKKPPRVRGKG